ncbi:MAG TPA: serine hydroxymethyltransferase [Acidimicrobiales bacterium]|nr:serine hydroxymethyltransferase [Acidimicrobiales bacterium]
MDSSPLDAWIADDDEIASLLHQEWNRQTTTVQLIASENFASPAVLAAAGSILTNKYSEGYPGRRYYGGNQVVDEVEDLARRRLTALFGADHANVQPHCGANANVAVYEALLDAGDTILAMRLDQGGHLTHGSPASITSKFWKFVSYGVTPRSDDPAAPGEVIDFDNVRALALEHRPKLIVAGATAYARVIDPVPFREIADEVGALLMFDSAHVAGLIAGGSHPDPVPYADVVSFTTHKTLRGPRGGAIVCREEFAKKIDSAVFPGQQGGPLEHVIAAKAVAFKEASQPSFSTYTRQIVANSQAFGRALADEGFRLVSGGTDNHMVLLDLRDFDAELTGKVAQEALDRAGITTNRNTIPDDPRSAFITSGLRVGTAAETTAGMKEEEFATIASMMARALRQRDDERALAEVRHDVAALCADFNPYANFTK